MRKILMLLTVAWVVGLSGCADVPTTSTERGAGEIMPLAVPADIQALLEQHEDFGTGMADDTSPFSNPASDGYDVYAVTFLWGQLGGVPSSDVAPTDWSGSLSSDAEVTIDVRFIIDFEPGQDSLMPVGTPSRAEWVSSTGYDIDGLSFRVSVARDNTGSVAPYLLFATAPITLQLPFYQLEYYAAYYPLGNGQGLAVLARRLWHHPCPAGALRGSWHWQDNTNSNGTFDGLWLDNNGEPIGVYSGRFWTTSDGAREFEGSVSGYITDQVIAEFKGHWRFDDPRVCPTCGDDYGLFCGKIRWLDNSGTGVMRGSFGYLNSEVDAAVLPMIGVWKKICTNAHIHATNPTGD